MLFIYVYEAVKSEHDEKNYKKNKMQPSLAMRSFPKLSHIYLPIKNYFTLETKVYLVVKPS